MFRISKMTDYATVIMACLARQPDATLTAKQVTAQTHIGMPTVSKLLKQLSRCGLLNSQQGANGGYHLAKSPSQISLADILHALEGNFAMTACTSHPGQCQVEDICDVRDSWQTISEVIHDSLTQISLQDMLKPKQKLNDSLKLNNSLKIQTHNTPQNQRELS